MHIVKLDAIDSTNSYLKNLVLSGAVQDYTVVRARTQTKGRGQMGAQWQSDSGKNLTFSVLKYFEALTVSHQFLLTTSVTKALYDSLKSVGVPNLSIKWPNDILSGHLKICGILIENIFSGKQIKSTVIGIGLNVNQHSFANIAAASSLKAILGRPIDLDEVLAIILDELKTGLDAIETLNLSEAILEYEKLLFRKDKPSTFKNSHNDLFTGIIRGVSQSGKLRVTIENGILREFDLKEVKLLY